MISPQQPMFVPEPPKKDSRGMKAVIYVFVGLCALAILMAGAIWFFASIFNDTGSHVWQTAVNACFGLAFLIGAATIALVLSKPRFLRNGGILLAVAVIGTILTIAAATAMFWDPGIQRSVDADNAASQGIQAGT